MVRAEVNRVEPSPYSSELSLHPIHKAVKSSLIVIALRDAGLISDDDDDRSRPIRGQHGILGAIDPVEILDPMHVAVVDVQNPVPVEKNCSVGHNQLRTKIPS